jgi:ComF family protein
LTVFNGAIQTLRDGILSLTYPQECRICNQPVESWNDGIVCAACWDNRLVTKLFANLPGCLKCHLPMATRQSFPAPESAQNRFEPADPNLLPPTPFVEPLQASCRQCAPMPFTFARACGAYAGALEANVLFLKSQPHICGRLRQLLWQTFTANQSYLASDVVMPVPLHPARRLERGFNQAELLARLIAGHFHLRLDASGLERTQNTARHRAGMDAFDRQKSVKGAFQAAPAKSLQNASVLLVDDLFTTGSTICAAAQTLLEAGAAQVQVLTLARVIQA